MNQAKCVQIPKYTRAGIKVRSHVRRLPNVIDRGMLNAVDGEDLHLACVADVPRYGQGATLKIMSKFLKPTYIYSRLGQVTNNKWKPVAKRRYSEPPIFYVAYIQTNGGNSKQMFDSDVCYSRIAFGRRVKQIFREYGIKKWSRVVLNNA